MTAREMFYNHFMNPESMQQSIDFYLKNFALGTYFFHWINTQDPKELLTMTDCDEQGFMVGGIPVPVGHWGHQLKQGPPSRAYFKLISGPKASEDLCISKQDLEKLRSLITKRKT